MSRLVTYFNAKLASENRPYLLIGAGRWGSTEPWLGVPVEWDEISGARVIVEAGFRDFRVTPSQSNHFFQNLTAFQVGYSPSIPISAKVPSIGNGCRRNLTWTARLRTSSALQRSIAPADEWAIQSADDFKPNSRPDGAAGG